MVRPRRFPPTLLVVAVSMTAVALSQVSQLANAVDSGYTLAASKSHPASTKSVATSFGTATEPTTQTCVTACAGQKVTRSRSAAAGVVLPSGLCDGVTDRFTDIQSAITTATATAGNTVTLPAGVCLVNGTLKLKGTYPVTLSGAGLALTTLRETGAYSLVAASNNGTVVQQVTLDVSSTNCGCHAFETSADNTQLLNAKLLGGTGYSGVGTASFTAYYGGDFSKSGRGYALGNVMTNVVDVDQDCDDGVSFSYQHSASITNLTETGSRLALYRDVGVTVNGDHYTPSGCSQAQHAMWITPPSSDITISNFVSAGFGGRFCPNKVGTCSSITVNGEQAANGLVIGNISGVTVQNSTFGGWLEVNVTYPGFTTTGSWTSSSATKVECSGAVSIAGIGC